MSDREWYDLYYRASDEHKVYKELGRTEEDNSDEALPGTVTHYTGHLSDGGRVENERMAKQGVIFFGSHSIVAGYDAGVFAHDGENLVHIPTDHDGQPVVHFHEEGWVDQDQVADAKLYYKTIRNARIKMGDVTVNDFPMPWADLSMLDCDKKALLGLMGFEWRGIDSALPHDWLVKFVEEYSTKYGFDYRAMVWSTFFTYQGQNRGTPLTACKEVNDALVANGHPGYKEVLAKSKEDR